MLWSNNLNEDYNHLQCIDAFIYSDITHNLENKKMVFYILDYYELQLHV